MANERKANETTDRDQESAPVTPDSETLHTTDPQEKMKGPFSSTMHETGEGFDTDDSEKEAEEKRDQNL